MEPPNHFVGLLAEVYGLITGPPAWRKSLLAQLKQSGFKRHPLAPCVVLMYEPLQGTKEELSGLIVIEIDDLPGGGVGDRFFYKQ